MVKGKKCENGVVSKEFTTKRAFCLSKIKHFVELVQQNRVHVTLFSKWFGSFV
jgi:hypothetical protein